MKNKIRFRLLLYFSGSLLAFSLIIGLVFFSLFSRHNMDFHKIELAKRSERIAGSLAGLWSEGAEQRQGQGHGHNHEMMGKNMGYGAYLRFIDDIAMSDVWIVDRSLEQIVRTHGKTSLAYKDLPPGAEKVILQAMDGQPTFSESFGTFIGMPSITVATPIVLPGGEVAGVVLLHENIENIRGVTKNGLTVLLLSMGVAIVVSFFIAGALSGHFTKPLGKMKTAALKISSGDYTATTGVMQDDEIGELAVALDEMAAKLDTASQESAKLEKLRKDFVANISHELRTPVTVIRGSLEALCEGVVSKPGMVEDYHRQMLSESIYLERLVSDLLSLARLQNPDFAIDMEDVDLKEIVTDALRGMKRLAGPKNIELSLGVSGDDFTVHGDYGRLRQLLVIVLDNAIKFSPLDSTVHLDMKQTAEGLTLSIRDEGRGIPPDELPYIFERFHKQRSEGDKSGTGLGLAIAKEIAARHKITIEVQSQPGQGTVFTLFFPKNTR